MTHGQLLELLESTGWYPSNPGYWEPKGIIQLSHRDAGGETIALWKEDMPTRLLVPGPQIGTGGVASAVWVLEADLEDVPLLMQGSLVCRVVGAARLEGRLP